VHKGIGVIDAFEDYTIESGRQHSSRGEYLRSGFTVASSENKIQHLMLALHAFCSLYTRFGHPCFEDVTNASHLSHYHFIF